MDRARRAEPYSSATIWTREVAKNLAGHLARISNAHSCVDTSSPKSTQLPKSQHTRGSKRCVTSPVKTRKALVGPLATAMEASNGVHYCSSSTGRGEEECADNQDEQKHTESSDQRREEHAQPYQHKSRHPLGHARFAAPLKLPADVVLLPESDQDEVPHETRKTLDKVRVPGRLKAEGFLGDSMYDCPPTISNGKLRPGMDYKQKQAQLKIWQENQALAKRLRSTKPTLKSKDWERDDKWNQEFLKSQERRRSLLQTELVKPHTTVKPHATIVRIRPLNLPHNEAVKTDELLDGANVIGRCSTSAVDGSALGSLSAREIRRRRSRSRTLEDNLFSGGGTLHLRSSAANHRRIMQLRQQKCMQPTGSETDEDAFAKERVSDSTVDLNDDELVDVRFTFSRRRSRKASRAQEDDGGEVMRTGEVPNSVDASRTVVKHDEGDITALSGASSSVFEVEDPLNHCDSKKPSPTQGAVDAGGSSQPRESNCQGMSTSALTESPGDESEASKITVDPHLLPANILLSERSASDCCHHEISNSDRAGMSEEVSTGSGSDVGSIAGGNDETDTLLTPSNAPEVANTNGVDSLPRNSSDVPAQRHDDGVNSISHRAEEMISTGGDQGVVSIASDWRADADTDRQHITSSTEGVMVVADKEEAAPRMDENAGSAPLERQQPDDVSAVAASLAEGEPEHQDDASDDDYQHDDDQIGDNREEEEMPALDGEITVTEPKGEAAADEEDDNEYGSEYEDDAEPDHDEEQARAETVAQEEARHHEHEHEHEDRIEDEHGNEQDEYSDDEFADEI